MLEAIKNRKNVLDKMSWHDLEILSDTRSWEVQPKDLVRNILRKEFEAALDTVMQDDKVNNCMIELEPVESEEWIDQADWDAEQNEFYNAIAELGIHCEQEKSFRGTDTDKFYGSFEALKEMVQEYWDDPDLFVQIKRLGGSDVPDSVPTRS